MAEAPNHIYLYSDNSRLSTFLLPDSPCWPSRSKEQIFCGKEASPSRYQRGSCAVSREKTMCSVGNRLVSPHGVSACATIESIFPVFFCPFNPLRTHQLELTVNLRPNAPGGPSWRAPAARPTSCASWSGSSPQKSP